MWANAAEALDGDGIDVGADGGFGLYGFRGRIGRGFASEAFLDFAEESREDEVWDFVGRPFFVLEAVENVRLEVGVHRSLAWAFTEDTSRQSICHKHVTVRRPASAIGSRDSVSDRMECHRCLSGQVTVT